jgi:type I protein arginine methyltransferase
MIGDSVRMCAYTQALREAVKPGSSVLDIGTGTGIFAMLATQFGARRVYAIEPSDAIQVARDIAAASGCAERIEFIQDISTKVTLPERVDVIISDLRGVLPLHERHIPSIVDARERFLAPEGRLIPLRDSLRAAVVESPALYDRFAKPWGDGTHGLDMEPAHRFVTNRWGRVSAKREEILLPPQTWATLDYTLITDADVSGEASWIAAKSGTAHGLFVWFDAVMGEGARFTNAPGEPELIYGSAFFPFSQPVALDVGDKVTAAISADLVGADYVWRWNTVVVVPGNPERAKAAFRQSTFYGTPFSPAELRRMGAAYVPTLDEDGQVDRLILSLIDGVNSLETIARRLAAQFPGRFASWRTALNHVSVLSKTYSRRPGGAPSA